MDDTKAATQSNVVEKDQSESSDATAAKGDEASDGIRAESQQDAATSSPGKGSKVASVKRHESADATTATAQSNALEKEQSESSEAAAAKSDEASDGIRPATQPDVATNSPDEGTKTSEDEAKESKDSSKSTSPSDSPPSVESHSADDKPSSQAKGEADESPNSHAEDEAKASTDSSRSTSQSDSPPHSADDKPSSQAKGEADESPNSHAEDEAKASTDSSRSTSRSDSPPSVASNSADDKPSSQAKGEEDKSPSAHADADDDSSSESERDADEPKSDADGADSPDVDGEKQDDDDAQGSGKGGMSSKGKGKGKGKIKGKGKKGRPLPALPSPRKRAIESSTAGNGNDKEDAEGTDDARQRDFLALDTMVGTWLKAGDPDWPQTYKIQWIDSGACILQFIESSSQITRVGIVDTTHGPPFKADLYNNETKKPEGYVTIEMSPSDNTLFVSKKAPSAEARHFTLQSQNGVVPSLRMSALDRENNDDPCIGWKAPCGSQKGKGGSCKGWGGSTTPWCFVSEGFEGIGGEFKQKSTEYVGMYFLPCNKQMAHLAYRDAGLFCVQDSDFSIGAVDDKANKLTLNAVCCDRETNTNVSCVENVNYPYAETKCESLGQQLCPLSLTIMDEKPDSCKLGPNAAFWTSQRCRVGQNGGGALTQDELMRDVFTKRYAAFVVVVQHIDFNALNNNQAKLDELLHGLRTSVSAEMGRGLSPADVLVNISASDNLIEFEVMAPPENSVEDLLGAIQDMDAKNALCARIKLAIEGVFSGVNDIVVTMSEQPSLRVYETTPADDAAPGLPGHGTHFIDKLFMAMNFFLPTLQLGIAMALLFMSSRISSDTPSTEIEQSNDPNNDFSPDANTLDGGVLLVRFKDICLEQRFQEEYFHRYIRKGSILLALSWLLAIVDRGAQLLLKSQCILERHHSLFEVPCLVIGFALASMCVLTGSWNRKPLFYGMLLLAFSIYVVIRPVPPLQPSCQGLKHLQERCGSMDRELQRDIEEGDCSLVGHTAQQVLVAWVLLLPHLIPAYVLMHSIWLWIAGYGIFMLSQAESIERDGSSVRFECISSTLMLSFASVIATGRRYFQELHMREAFLNDVYEKQATKKLFNTLEYMVPESVIGGMIKEPDKPIARTSPRCSVLFVVIEDFEEVAANEDMDPADTLQFLNAVFTQMDEICAKHRVLKVETVGEEYVACVGTEPADIHEFECHGYTEVLTRLFLAAEEISELQTETMVFKMGIHTGPIVSGVIGSKLPRFRLFGDTINTAARMMQTGIPGKLQFGQETMKDLPESILYEYRGTINMKGKGDVNTWLLVECGPQTTFFEHDDCCHEHEKRTRGPLLRAPSHDCPAENEDDCRVIGMEGFENILAEMEDDSTLFGKFGRVKLPEDVEKAWAAWYHETQICSGLVPLLDTQAVMLSLLTVVETAYLFRNRKWDADHNIFPTWLRLPMFVCIRSAVFVTLMFLRSTVSSSTWAVDKPFRTQTCLVIGYSSIAILMYISYSTLTVTDAELIGEDDFDIFGDPKARRQQRMDQMSALLFILIFHLVSTAVRLKFLQSLSFVVVAAWLMIANFGSLYFHKEGKILFVFSAAVGSLVAFEDETGSRQRFLQKFAVRQMEGRVEKILDSLMPAKVVSEAVALPLDAPPPSHRYAAATILQSDLCGFTKISATKRPNEVVQMVSDLFGRFDQLCDEYGCYKVETVGDAYIAGCAEHTLTEFNSPANVVKFGLAMIGAVDDWAVSMKVICGCRVGVHHGECIGGVVGTGMQRYHLFGTMMNAIEILESTAPENCVQLSPAAKGAAEHDHGPSGREAAGLNLSFTERDEELLVTSKGKEFHCSQVGGYTFLAQLMTNEDAILMRKSRAVSVSSRKATANNLKKEQPQQAAEKATNVSEEGAAGSVEKAPVPTPPPVETRRKSSVAKAETPVVEEAPRIPVPVETRRKSSVAKAETPVVEEAPRIQAPVPAPRQSLKTPTGGPQEAAEVAGAPEAAEVAGAQEAMATSADRAASKASISGAQEPAADEADKPSDASEAEKEKDEY
eukprot:TRINITY_DN2447_c0_g1_i5.p1 TRINITY_DN2447_c0_g1~~TRINITY_DN2447_c0_g1_i5.p1  ORF type:complete len:2187 (+),score=300.33 TRINITY_DN2447_c0_g1_i5:467-6562(+)